MSVELHLPDLPEVPISLGPVPARPRERTPWGARLRHALASSLPLAVMALLAMATWWLVQHSPRPPAAAADRAVSRDPDYSMSQFSLDRFDAGGRLKLRIEGTRMRHYPATDRVEIEGVRIAAYSPEGRVTRASAQLALGNSDGSELQLFGGVVVRSIDGGGMPLEMRGEFMHAFLLLERMRSHLPVQVTQAGREIDAQGLEYDHAAQRLELQGPLRTVLPARGANAKRPGQVPRAHAAAAASAAAGVR